MLATLVLLAVQAPAEMVRVEASEIAIEDSSTGLKQTARVGAFLMGRTEVTEAEFGRPGGGAKPVTNVSWFETVRYANQRSVRERLRPCYDAGGVRVAGCNGYRLPTGAEWSIAAAQPTDLASANLRGGGVDDLRYLTGSVRPVGSGQANARGIHDLYGNVWEWCEDWYTPEPLLDAVRDPMGPAEGVERLIRGGSYLSTRGQWNKGFTSSFAPERRSPYTGFRLVRSIAPAAALPAPDAAWLEQFQEKPAGMKAAAAVGELGEVRAAWTKLLGLQEPAKGPVAVRSMKRYREAVWNGELLEVEVEPGWTARVLVMEPVRKPAGKLPVVVVPFYDVDSPAGENLGGRRSGGGVRAFAKLAVQRGFLAVAVRWYGEGDGEGYDESVKQLAARHPGLTGMAKWIGDARRLVDYLVTRPDVDARRIGIIGHSLGGKMALYAAAFDPRIRVIVSSEPGIALGFTNYEAFWYLGRQRPKDRDQQDLLGLIAPRPFLLIAGESSDGDKSWPYLLAGQEVYGRLGARRNLGALNHRAGHSPTSASVLAAMDWLERFLVAPI